MSMKIISAVQLDKFILATCDEYTQPFSNKICFYINKRRKMNGRSAPLVLRSNEHTSARARASVS